MVFSLVSCQSESETEYTKRLIGGVCHCKSDAAIDIHWSFPDSNAIRAMSQSRRDSLLQNEKGMLQVLSDCMKQHGFSQKDVDHFWTSYEAMKNFDCDSSFVSYQHYIFRLMHGYD